MRLSRGLALAVWLGSGAVLSSAAGVTGFSAPGVAYAGSCAPLASNPTDLTPSHGFGTFTDMEQSFTDARAAEGCTTPLDLTANEGISEATWNSDSPAQQMFVLYNAERQDRGINLLNLDSTLMSPIAYNHSREFYQYNYFSHNSPVNGGIPDRLIENPAIGQNWDTLAENIAQNATAAAAVFEYMYDDGSSPNFYDHRQIILGYASHPNSPDTYGKYDWVGNGVYPSRNNGLFFTSDFLQSLPGGYSPPATVDTTAPTMSSPTVSGSPGSTVTAMATNVGDSGASAGAAGLTGVVFYAGPPEDSNSNSTTVLGTQNGTTWTASLNQPAGTVVHAVAVDGSGNYTDCTVGGSCMSSLSSGPTAAHVTHLAVSHHGSQTVFRWSVAPNHQIAGFNLYAGTLRLNAHLIASMQRTSFRYTVRRSGPGRFILEVVMSNGQAVRVAAR